MRAQKNLESIQLLKDGLIYYSFYDKDKPNYIFANYWNEAQPLIINRIKYKTPEHYFQSQKFLPSSKEHNAICNAVNADEARVLAGKLFNEQNQTPQTLAKWRTGNPAGGQVAMLNVVRARLKDLTFRENLLATRNAYILEDTYKGPGGKADAIWGGGADGMGENKLGLALMQVRNEERGVKVDLDQLREIARQERAEIDRNLGGSDATKGKPLSEIRDLLANRSSKTHSVAPVAGKEPRPAAGAPNFFPPKRNAGVQNLRENEEQLFAKVLTEVSNFRVPSEIKKDLTEIVNNYREGIAQARDSDKPYEDACAKLSQNYGLDHPISKAVIPLLQEIADAVAKNNRSFEKQ